MREEPRFVVSYVAPDEEWQNEFEWIPPVIGNGVESPQGIRYRIVDVWIVYPKRGPFEYGVHAFLQPVDAADDRLHLTRPDYYSRRDT